MKHIKLIAVIGIAALMNISSLCAQNKEVSLSSPDKNLQVTFRTVSPAETGEQNSVESASGNKLVYDIIFQDKQLISPSAMGVELEGSPLLGENVKITGTTFQQGEDRYQLKTGKTSQVNEKYNSVLISLAEERTNRQLQVEARAYNGAVAFRYIVPEQPGMAQYRLVNEKQNSACRRMPQHTHKWCPTSAAATKLNFIKYQLLGFPIRAVYPVVTCWGYLWCSTCPAEAGLPLQKPIWKTMPVCIY